MVEMTIPSTITFAGEAQTGDSLEQLMLEQAEPLIREIVSHRLRGAFDAAGRPALVSESEDVCSEIRLQLLTRLAEIREDRRNQNGQNDPEIRDFRSYVAVVAFRACYEHLRRKYPKRYSLKNKLRFLLSHKAEFSLWQTGRDEWLCGLAAWQNILPQQLASNSLSQLRFNQLRDNPHIFDRHLSGVRVELLRLENLLLALFEWLGQPIELDQLVGIVAELRGIKDRPAKSDEQNENAESALARLADPRANVAKTFDQRRYLEALWNEIIQLSPRHCTALLLNLKDERGASATDLFIFTGVVKFPQLAAALSLSEEELAQLWNQLPLDDLTIAARLGLTRQQVINLRQSARTRLARRMNQLGY